MLKSPIERKQTKNIETAGISNNKIVLEIIQKICNVGKAFTFRYNKCIISLFLNSRFCPFGQCILEIRKIETFKSVS